MKITLDLSDKHAYALMHACEVLARCGMGQFKTLADSIIPWQTENRTGIDALEGTASRHTRVDGFEDMAKLLLMPELYRGGYWAMHNKKVPATCQLAWEVYAAIRHAAAWASLAAEGRTEPEFHGCQYDQPMSVSGEPMPTVTVALEGQS
jgi:hypothetical protein